MAIDYREVNQFLKVSANQLPYQNMLFQQLSGQKNYAKIDNLWGHQQLKLSDESSKVAAIISPFGVYRFLACPFGISTAPGEYLQARMAHQILKEFNLNGAVDVYIDDTVIYGANLGTFLERLDLVLERMARFNVRPTPRKCFFGMASAIFLMK